MKKWFRKNKDFILVSLFVVYLIFVCATEEPIPEVTEPTETESSLIQWKEPTEPSIEPSTLGSVTEPEESETTTEIPSEVDTSTETGTEIVEETETEPEEITYYCKWMDRYFTEEEFALICTTTFCESATRTSKEQTAVAIVILTQINSGEFGDTVRKVIFKKNNFSSTKWKGFEDYGWTEKVEKSVLSALEHNPYPRNMFYFRTDHYHDWAVDYMQIGVFYFSTDK